MEQYIPKSALVAEIERRRDLHYKYNMKNGAGSIAECKYDEDREILSFIDTLEVKEVDLESERVKYFENRGDMATVNRHDRYTIKEAWSEKDERMKNHLVDFMLSGIDISKAPYGCVAWLKSLKERYTWKPSDEQMKALEMAINEQKEEYGFTSLDSLYEQLKAL